MLYVYVNISCVAAAFPFEDALSDGGDGRIVALLYSFKSFGEPPVVIANFGRPCDAGSIGVVAGWRWSREGM